MNPVAFPAWRRAVLAAAGAMLFAGLVSPMAAGAQKRPTFSGRWSTGQDGGVVAIGRCGDGRLCGRIVDGHRLRADRGQRDVHNPDPALRGRRVRELVVLDNIRDQDGVWHAGPVYDPLTGRGAPDATLTLGEDGATLAVRACVGVVFCVVQHWHRLH